MNKLLILTLLALCSCGPKLSSRPNPCIAPRYIELQKKDAAAMDSVNYTYFSQQTRDCEEYLAYKSMVYQSSNVLAGTILLFVPTYIIIRHRIEGRP
jgi:hypothetical protein